MANEIALSDSRAIARAAIGYVEDPAAIAAQMDRGQLVQAIEQYRQSMRPPERMPKAEAMSCRQELAQIIGGIGLRIRPDYNEKLAKLWTAEMVTALEGIPFPVSIAAAKEARRMPIGYPAEVLGIILELAKPHQAKHDLAMRNLERFLKELDNPTTQIEAKPFEPMTDEELQEMPDHLRKLGIAGGWLREAENGRIEWVPIDEQPKDERHSTREGSK